MESEMEMGATQLVSLEDEQLDEVAGGFGRRRGWFGRRHGGFGHRRHGHGHSHGPNIDIDVDIDINIINFQGNQIVAGQDVNIILSQGN